MMASLSSSSELSLECKNLAQSQAMPVVKSLANHNNHSPDHATLERLQEYLHRLEEESLKIDAFKRELPLCMHLLTHEMEASRQQLQSYNRENQGTRPVLEEFMPLKHSSNSEGSDQKPANMSDKANWMTSAQLWSQAGDGNKQQSSTLPKTKTDIGFSNVNPKLGFDTKHRNGGAFLPFANDHNSGVNNSSIGAVSSVPDLALASSERELLEDKKLGIENGNGINGSKTENPSKGGNEVTEKAADSTTTQAHRKARRCWSPDLHRRFVNALQMLGGSQVATPKQIRELMKVDGLTNDEVKSHLQKYRLHTRRPGPSPTAAGAPAPQLVVLGGIWVPQEYTTATAAVHGGAPTIYSTTHPTSQISPHYTCSPAVPQDFYAPPPPPLLPPPHAHSQLHHSALHHHHHQVHVYKTSSHTEAHSSPESDARGVGVGDRSESIEDGKSENSSWKSSGDNDGDGKKLVALRDDGVESNGSEITLKF